MFIKRGVAIVMVTMCIFAVEAAMSLVPKGDLLFPSSAAAPGEFPDQWIHGSKSAMDNTDPAVQVHRYNDHTYILRENKAINYEGAFMYVFFGNGVALLIDQGSTSSPALFPLREVVDELIANWEAEFDQSSTHLI
ncbi:MAG: hypothetical protein VX122_01150, partial [Pseudomonadota bacterium]|nr:hypothetical protein [Pseudomonadota bacterium]